MKVKEEMKILTILLTIGMKKRNESSFTDELCHRE